jgi:IstB-like ATP binding protein
MPCLSRLKLTGVRDQLDSLIDEASVMISQCVRRLALLCEREIARKNQHRIETPLKLAQVPFLRDLTGFDFAAQPSVDPEQIRDSCRCPWGIQWRERPHRLEGAVSSGRVCRQSGHLLQRCRHSAQDQSHAGAVRSGQHAQRLRVRRDEKRTASLVTIASTLSPINRHGTEIRAHMPAAGSTNAILSCHWNPA